MRAGASHLWATVRGLGGTLRHPSRWTLRWTTFGVLGLLYVALSVLIVVPHTFVLRFDTYLVDLHLWHKHPDWHPWVAFVVGFGQRWIMTYTLQLIIVWAALRSRSIRPLVLFGSVIVLLNVTVGCLKYLIGRTTPIHGAGAHTFHFGNDLFPSGHVSNAVVLYGVLAWAVPKYRRPVAVFAVIISICVGLGTVYLKTHWFSDVVGGWLIGAMVLIALPSVLPWTNRFAELLIASVRGALADRPVWQGRASRVLAWLKARVPADPQAVAHQAAMSARERQTGSGGVAGLDPERAHGRRDRGQVAQSHEF